MGLLESIGFNLNSTYDPKVERQKKAAEIMSGIFQKPKPTQSLIGMDQPLQNQPSEPSVPYGMALPQGNQGPQQSPPLPQAFAPMGPGETPQPGQLPEWAQPKLSEPQMPERLSPLEEMRKKTFEMMRSGNPLVQEQGMALLKQYYQQAQPGKVTHSSAYKMGVDAGLSGQELQDFVLQQANKQTEMFERKGSQPMSVSELGEIVRPDGTFFPYGITPDEARAQGAIKREAKTASDAGRLAMLKTSMRSFPYLDKLFMGLDGEIDEKALDAAYYLDQDPTGTHIFADNILRLTGWTGPDLERAKLALQALNQGFFAITRTETGAAMPAEEVQHTKTRFQPNPMDPKSVKMEKYLAYKYFITNAAQMMDQRIQYNGTKEEITAEVNRFADESFKHTKAQMAERNNDSAATPGVDQSANPIYDDTSNVDFGDD